MIKKITTISLVVMFLFVGTVFAKEQGLPKAGILPSSPFYFLKSLSEDLGTLFSIGNISKVERFTFLAEKRLAEANTLADKGDTEGAKHATEKYQEYLDKAVNRAEEAKKDGDDVDEVLTKVAEATTKHRDVLERIYEKVPEQAREAIKQAIENSSKGGKDALEAISEEKQDEVRKHVDEKILELEKKRAEDQDSEDDIDQDDDNEDGVETETEDEDNDQDEDNDEDNDKSPSPSASASPKATEAKNR